MNHITQNLIKINFAVLIVLFLVTLSCSDDPSSPTKEDPIPQETVTIGIEGGTIEKNDFKLTIPAGAFDGNYNISISEVTDDEAFGENTVTPSFKISGIPSNYSKPLKIVAKYFGELSEESYMGISKKVYDIINADSSIVYDLLSATDSIGYLISSIPLKAINNLPKSVNTFDETDNLDILIKFLTSYTHSETEHFLIRYPVIYIEKIPLLAQIFEDAYTIVYKGFQMTVDDRLLKVYILTQEKDISTEVFEKDSVCFYVNKERVFSQQLNKIQFRGVQGLFYSSLSYMDRYHWISWAIMDWIEDLISEDPNYKYPIEFLDFGLESFGGFNGFDTKEVSHSAGMSAVFNYLYNTEDLLNKKYLELSEIGDIYRNDLDLNLMTRLIISVEAPVNEWWPDYFKKLVNNELFELPGDYFISRAHATWEINTENDILKIFTSNDVGKYRDLSAKIFKVNLNYSDFDNTQNLTFKINGPDNNKDLSLILFSIKDNKPEYMETINSSEYEIKDLKSFSENVGKQILAILVNSNITQDDYFGKSEITLEISVTPKIGPFNYKRCKVVAQVLADVERKYHNGTIDTTKEIINEGSSGNYGTFEGNTFTSEILSDSSQMILNVLLNETQDTIIHFEWSRIINYTDQYNTVLNQSISGKNIPINLTDKTIYEIQGSYTCNYLNTFDYEYTYGDAYIKIPTFSCDLESYIFLQFFEE